jgi:hypothetical protein
MTAVEGKALINPPVYQTLVSIPTLVLSVLRSRVHVVDPNKRIPAIEIYIFDLTRKTRE